MSTPNKISAYKVFNPDWSCRDFKYEVGKSYHQEGKIIPCKNGFHACKRAVDCFNYYDFNTSNRVAEVEVWGEVVYHEDKIVSSDITVVRELSWVEVFDLVNTGKGNTGQGNSGSRNSGNRNSGYRNSGDYNSGYRNSGDYNSGSRNSGDYNSGDWNSGDRNSGDRNSGNGNSGSENSGDGNSGNGNSGDRNPGNWNSGNGNSGSENSGNGNSGGRNSGDRNSGDRNSGSWNSCNRSTGYFNSKSQDGFVPVFNGAAYIRAEEFEAHPGYVALYEVDFSLRGEHGNAIPYKDACREWWNKMPEEAKKLVQTLPGFRADVFEEITGINVDVEE